MKTENNLNNQIVTKVRTSLNHNIRTLDKKIKLWRLDERNNLYELFDLIKRSDIFVRNYLKDGQENRTIEKKETNQILSIVVITNVRTFACSLYER